MLLVGALHVWRLLSPFVTTGKELGEEQSRWDCAHYIFRIMFFYLDGRPCKRTESAYIWSTHRRSPCAPRATSMRSAAFRWAVLPEATDLGTGRIKGPIKTANRFEIHMKKTDTSPSGPQTYIVTQARDIESMGALAGVGWSLCETPVRAIRKEIQLYPTSPNMTLPTKMQVDTHVVYRIEESHVKQPIIPPHGAGWMV